MYPSTLLSTLTAATCLFTLALCNPAAAAAAQPQITPGPVLAPHAARQFTLPVETDDDDHTDHDTDFDISPSSISKALACQSKYLSLVNAQPWPSFASDRALASWLASEARSALATVTAATQIDVQLTTLCDATRTITPPASLQSAYSEYLAESTSWASSVAPQAHSIASECGGEVSALVEWLVVTDEQSCTSAVMGLVEVWGSERFGTTTTGSSSSGGSGSGSGSNTAATRTTTTGSGPTGTTGGPGGAAVSTSSSSTAGVAAPRETGFVAYAAAAAVAVGVAGVVAAL